MTRPRQLAVCRDCQCTDVRACPGGCWWIAVDYATSEGICSRYVHAGKARPRRRRS